jgi:hypothetical protein
LKLLAHLAGVHAKTLLKDARKIGAILVAHPKDHLAYGKIRFRLGLDERFVLQTRAIPQDAASRLIAAFFVAAEPAWLKLPHQHRPHLYKGQ